MLPISRRRKKRRSRLERKMVSSKELASRLSVLFAKIIHFLRWCFFVIFILSAILGFILAAYPNILLQNSDSNIVFIVGDNDGKIIEIFYAHIKANEKIVNVFRLAQDYEFYVLDQEQQIIEKSLLSDFLSSVSLEDINEQELNSMVFWVTGRFVDEVVVVEQSDIEYEKLPEERGEGESGMMKRVWQHRLLKSRGGSLQQNILREWLSSYFLVWSDYFTVLSQNDLPITKVFNSDSNTCSVAVLNATQISGYAQLVANVLENSQVRVIRMDSFPELLDKTKLVVGDSSKTECHYLAEIIGSGLFPTHDKLSAEKSQSLNTRYRAEIVLILGE